MAQEVGTGGAGGVAANIINKALVAPIMQQIDDLIHMDRNNQFLQVKLERMKNLLQDISNDFENQQRVPAESITYCLGRMRDAIQEATDLSARSQQKQNWFFYKASISRQITKLNAKFDQLFQELSTDFGIFQRAQQIVSAASPQEKDVLLQPSPDGGFVGSGIESAEAQLQVWINEEAPQVRVIGVHGMAGVGKTTLLRRVHNSYQVSSVFDVVIWVTVSQDYKISNLQDQIAEAIGLDLSNTSNPDTRTMMLSASLKKKNFFLILDDMWSQLNLQELGVTFGDDKVSKLVFSTRNRELASVEAHRSLRVEPLSMEEGWELFQRVAFKDGHVPEELKKCAMDFADECGGLPLAITVVAATMRGKTPVVYEWNNCLCLMRIADPSFPDTHPRVDKQLYRRLRWSYDHLPNLNLQNCFLYSATYPEDHLIWVDELVQFWIAEGFVKSKEGTYSMDMQIGYDYVRLLIDRGLFKNYNFEKRSMRNAYKPVNVWKVRQISVHDVIRDMAIHIGEKEGNYLCRAGQGIKDFPQTLTRSCKRISLSHNQIEYLPKNFLCPQLVSLVLWANPLTYDVPENFLSKLTALRVLDLAESRITSVPASLTQLTLLECLDLNDTPIKELPRDICNLSQLRFLNLSWCKSLTSLPDTIGKLTQLQRVMLSGCNNLVLPAEISQVTSLKRLWWDVGTPTEVLKDPANVIALKGLTNLRELNLSLWLEFEAQELMGSCLEMRHLRLSYNNFVNNTLPHGIQNMKKLESLRLCDFIPVDLPMDLPNWICEFEQLERLELTVGGKELPSLERLPNLKFLKLAKCDGVIDLGIGSSQKPGGFPKLETLVLKYMVQLQSMTCPSCEGGVLKEGTLSNLCVLKIQGCPALKKLPVGMDKLPKLRIYGEIGLV